MARTVRPPWGRAALTLLLSGTAAAASAGPLLSPLLPSPSLFATLAAPPTTSGLSVGGVPIPTTLAAWSPQPSDSWSLSQSLRLGSPWITLRASDPSLRFATWRQVLNVARLGKFVVPLRRDPAERTNIILAAQAVDGATVAPGAVFSFNRTVGERTPERGYRDGLMFSEGQLIRGTGGGICIIATGIYNAALHAGMGLVERHPHSGIVGYAPPGCDASIVYGSEDMQFRNTSDAPVVVKTDIREEQVVVSLYGQTPPPDFKVFVKTTRLDYIHAPVIEQPDAALPPDGVPVVTQKPRLGFDVTVERVITRKGGVPQRETVASEHRTPRPKIVRVPVPPAAPQPPPVPMDGPFTFHTASLAGTGGSDSPSPAAGDDGRPPVVYPRPSAGEGGTKRGTSAGPGEGGLPPGTAP